MSLALATTQHIVLVNGTYLYYEKYGKGKPLILLHGWTQTSAFWKPYIGSLGSEYEVYCVDLRGHGRSSPLTKDFSIRRAAGDVEELVEKLQLRRVIAVGLSYGGLVLLELSLINKDLIDSMILIGTSYRYNGKDAQKGKPVFTYDALDSVFRNQLLQQHIHGEEQVRALFDPELNYSIDLSEDDLKNIRSRVLVIHGDSDEVADYRQAVQMQKLIPKASLWIVPDTGHLALTNENRQEFIERARSFFAIAHENS